MKLDWTRLISNFSWRDAARAVVGAAMFLPFTFCMKLFSREATLFDAIQAAFLAGILVAASVRIYSNLLIQRSENQTEDLYECAVNDVPVGTINGKEYAKLKLRILNDEKAFLGELVAFYSSVFGVVNFLMRRIPIACFWVALGAAYFEPSTFSSFWIGAQDMTPEKISMIFSAVAPLVGIFMMFSFGIQMLAGTKASSGYAFDSKKELRSYFNQPANGAITLTRCNSDKPNVEYTSGA